MPGNGFFRHLWIESGELINQLGLYWFPILPDEFSLQLEIAGHARWRLLAKPLPYVVFLAKLPNCPLNAQAALPGLCVQRLWFLNLSDLEKQCFSKTLVSHELTLVRQPELGALAASVAFGPGNQVFHFLFALAPYPNQLVEEGHLALKRVDLWLPCWGPDWPYPVGEVRRFGQKLNCFISKFQIILNWHFDLNNSAWDWFFCVGHQVILNHKYHVFSIFLLCVVFNRCK